MYFFLIYILFFKPISSQATSNTTNSTNVSYYVTLQPYFSSSELSLINAYPIDFASLDMNQLNLTSCLANSTLNSTSIMSCFYQKFSFLLTKYIIDFPNPEHYIISIFVDPCYGQNEDTCKKNADSKSFIDAYRIKATSDLLLAWFMNNYILQCGNEFKNLNSCGTFLEIHRPFDEAEIIEEVQMSNYNITGYEFTYISTKKLCAGKYEIWLVFRTRIGKILQYVKPFFVEFPSCGCDTVKRLTLISGYSC